MLTIWVRNLVKEMSIKHEGEIGVDPHLSGLSDMNQLNK